MELLSYLQSSKYIYLAKNGNEDVPSVVAINKVSLAGTLTPNAVQASQTTH